MDTLSIGSTTATGPAPPPAPAGTSASTKFAADARPDMRPGDAGKPPAQPSPENAAPPRDSRSVQYMVQGNRVITTIVDEQSKQVVVQIPDAELIRIAKSIDRMQGFFIEQKA